ncbi:MAG TPA: M48 family metallopeptidase [Bacteroidaceae bacterium]|nr:M48 family metallopeptidase [Bacteroidaceae bacterium]
MMGRNNFLHPKLGEIIVKKNFKAKGISMRPTAEGVIVTVPVFLSGNRVIKQVLDSNIVNLSKNQAQIRVQNKKNPHTEEDLIAIAKRVLPEKLFRLSKKHGLPFNKVTVRRSRTRWGSCSTKKNISLSCYLVLLPDHLVEYVMIHELCHTIEMNHSDRFWALVEKNTGGKSKELRAELRKHRVIP